MSKWITPETWMVVSPSSSIPGGYRVTHWGLDEDTARSIAVSYESPHKVIRTSELYQIRMEALEVGL